MSTTFPTTIQDLDATRGSSGSSMASPSHAGHHQTEDDTIEALQAKVGVTGSAVVTSLDYLVAQNTAKVTYPSADSTKLAGIETAAEVNNISDANATDLTDGGETNLHSHAAGSGVDTSGTPVANDIARFTDADTIEGLSYTELRSAISVEENADVTDTANVTSAGALMDSEVTNLAQVKAFDTTDYQAVLSEGAFANGDKTKLDGIETAADVTDATNVTSAGALMDSEVTNLAEVKAFDSTDYVPSTPRVWTAASDATPDVDADDYDAVTITALAAAITDVNMSGTPDNFDKLIFRIKDNATARAITWGSDFEDAGQALPTTTVESKLLTVGFIYNSVTSKWGCVAVANET